MALIQNDNHVHMQYVAEVSENFPHILPNINYYPSLTIFNFPKNKRRLLIYSSTDTILTFRVRRYHHMHILIKKGLNVCCFCQLFKFSETSRRPCIVEPSFFCRFKALYMDIYDTYKASETLVVLIREKSEICSFDKFGRSSLWYTALISFLRLGVLFISKKKLRTLPSPINHLYLHMNVYNSKVHDTTVIFKKPCFKVGKHTNELHWAQDTMKWISVRNCISFCGTNPQLRMRPPLSPVPYIHGMYIYLDFKDFVKLNIDGGQSHENGDLRTINNLWRWRPWVHNGEIGFV